jgi:hypothetical protein
MKEPQLTPHCGDALLGAVGELEAVCDHGSGRSYGRHCNFPSTLSIGSGGVATRTSSGLSKKNGNRILV